MSWIYRTAPNDIDALVHGQAGSPESPPIQFLRNYSNYLTPKTGLFSADLWAALAIWLRNTTINFSMVFLSVTFLVTLPLLFGNIISHILGLSPVNLEFLDNLSLKFARSSDFLHNAIFFLWVIFLVFAMAFAIYNLRSTKANIKPFPRKCSQSNVLWLVAVPLLLASILCANWLIVWNNSKLSLDSMLTWSLYGAVVSLAIFSASAFLLADKSSVLETIAAQFKQQGIFSFFWNRLKSLFSFFYAQIKMAVWVIIAGSSGGMALYALSVLLASFAPEHRLWLATSLGGLLVLLIFSMMVGLFIAMARETLTEQQREWWGRLWGIAGAIGMVWCLLVLVAVYSPPVVDWLIQKVGIAWSSAGGFAAVLSIAIGVVFGKKSMPDEKTSMANTQKIIVMSAPWVLILVLFCGSSYAIQALVNDTNKNVPIKDTMVICANKEKQQPPCLAQYLVTQVNIINAMTLETLKIVLGGIMLLLYIIIKRVDVNLFSLHHFYRNRLVRCYLGASHSPDARNPSPFTGFDPNDDNHNGKSIGVADLKRSILYPIVNTTVNFVSEKDLGWQKRQGASFVFTPMYTGFALSNGEEYYRETPSYMGEGGPALSTVMTTSGAAANSMMGYHSSPAVAFMLSVFNARLGRWCGNPKHPSTSWKKSSPDNGGYYFLLELFGLANLSRPFVNLSDGGHFENLGIYELVRRRCHVIIACDAEEDGNYYFEGLANTIRKCQVDFGIPIEFNTTDLPKLRPNHIPMALR